MQAQGRAVEGQTLGRTATLQLDLIEARRRLKLLLASRQQYDELDVQSRAMADEYRVDGKHQQAGAMTAASVRYRCQIISLDVELRGLRGEVADIEAALAASPAPAVLSAAQCADMDETMGATA
jgi:hypothetical protein